MYVAFLFIGLCLMLCSMMAYMRRAYPGPSCSYFIESSLTKSGTSFVWSFELGKEKRLKSNGVERCYLDSNQVWRFRRYLVYFLRSDAARHSGRSLRASQAKGKLSSKRV